MSTRTSETMKAIQVYTEGGPEVLVYEDVPRPTAGPGEVLIRVYAAGVNPADWRARAGFPDVPEQFRHAIPPIPRPSIPGFDVSGIVGAVGLGVTEFREGDAVYGMVRFPHGGKGYAEYTTAPVTDLARKPATIDHLQAAAVPMAALTAWQMLYLDLEAGQTVLINGAAGGVGHFAVQLAKLKGARVIGVASGRHAAFLRELGVDQFIDYTVAPIEQVIHDIDVVFDTVGGENNRLLSVLKRGGRFVPINIGNYSAERAALAGITIGTSHHQLLQSSGVQLAEIGKLIDTEQVHVAIDTVVPLAEARKAHERGEAGHIRGKMVLRVVE
ncbi:MAG: NADP-dependent oxidoreductase [Ktedonobacteraceae bacterium]|nr:NADP-dependent oxidoreductase [Ktedonobacteraceae bacterium]